MSKIMLIDAAHAEETRVVVIDGNRVEEFDFESQNRKQLRGNIYLAKVTRVEPSLQAAFVEYGGNRHGFLAFNEIHPDYYQIPLADREALMREEAEDHDDDRPEPRSRGGDDDEDGDASGSDDDDDVMDEEVARRRRRLMRRYKIQEVIRRRQIMLVQVVKEERGNKGAALTTYLSLAGRYGVLMPNTARGGGISRKITTITDRKRLKSVVTSLDVPAGMGLIVRTAGAKRTKAEIKRDYDYLLRLWENIREKTLHSIAPALIYEEEDLVKRTIRDLYDKDIDEVWVEGEAAFKEARDFMRMLMPSQAKKVQAYRDPAPLFVQHRVEDHLSQIYSPVVPLRSGGYLVINQTEALVAVDVNSGRSTRERNIEATALKTNMEAAEEASRQLRLRDLAGLIVIDFIDMDEAKNNRAVEKKLKDCLKDDRARVQMGKISPFGLMEISRQRRRSGVLEGTTHVCEHCAGTGRVRSVESSALSALRALEVEALKGGGEATLRVPGPVGLYILNEKRQHLARLHHAFGLFATVVVEDAMSHADHVIERTSMETRPDHAVALPAPARGYEAPEDDDFDDAVEDDVDEIDDEAIIDDDIEDDEDEDDAGSEPSRARGESRVESSSDDADGARRSGRRRRRRGRRGDEPREQASEPRADAPVIGESEEDAASRRRRRGRRGGRRMREDGRPQDSFSWVRPWVPYGDDPFVWHDPAEDMKGPSTSDQPRAPRAETPRIAPPAAPAASSDDIWVELPASDDKPKRPRRARGRGRGRVEAEVETEVVAPEPVLEIAAPVEVVAEPEPAAEAVVAQAPAKRSRARKTPAAAVVVEEAPVEAAVLPEEPPPAPAAPREPDPAEIAGSPPAARKGWWRRG
jgi:ribonuclease E